MLIDYSTLTYYIYAFLVYTRMTDATFRSIRIYPNMPEDRKIAPLNSMLVLKLCGLEWPTNKHESN